MLYRSFLLLVTLGNLGLAQQEQGFPPVKESDVRHIDALRTSGPIRIDGKLDEQDWKRAPESPRFVDLISGHETIHDTRVRLLWDDDNLYVGYTVQEPDVKATFTKRDSPIYQENDVEFFIAGEDAYYEFEINALGTIYEGLFAWQDSYISSGIASLPQLDRTRDDVRCQAFNGVGLKSHPRGLRWAFLDWDYPGAFQAVKIHGTLNDSTDHDLGWTVELSFPWKGLSVLNMSQPRTLPPRAGDVWRMDFSRFNQYKSLDPSAGQQDSGGWALSHHGIWDSHIPECFPFVTLRDNQD